jgi:hypothetical protein
MRTTVIDATVMLVVLAAAVGLGLALSSMLHESDGFYLKRRMTAAQVRRSLMARPASRAGRSHGRMKS